MLLQGCTRIMYKHMLEHRIAFNLLQINAIRSVYGNHDAIKYITRYLRKREIVTDTSFEERRMESEFILMGFIRLNAFNKYDLYTFNLGEWWKHKRDKIRQTVEKYHYEENIKLGPDIAAAKFVIQFGGKAKFVDHDEWIDKTKKAEIAKLPEVYDPNYILDGLDLNGYALRYEHLPFILNLYYLKHLSLRGCKTINDWSLDKISVEYPKLEYLDITECENVTERGLEALYRMPSLKKLIVTNYCGSAAFDLTCLMLEDVNPYLTCEIQQPKYKVIPSYN